MSNIPPHHRLYYPKSPTALDSQHNGKANFVISFSVDHNSDTVRYTIAEWCKGGAVGWVILSPSELPDDVKEALFDRGGFLTHSEVSTARKVWKFLISKGWVR